MFILIRKSKLTKVICAFILVNMLFDAVMPKMAFALTGGPSQPEVQSFAPIGTSDMVDAFTGDFKYNIPLMDVGGYPINLIYNSGVSMDQEASWVGLGWNLNPGVVNRSMRGVPDDFGSEDMIKKQFHVKDNQTYTVYLGGSVEIAGLPIGLGLSRGMAISYNTYSGVDVVNSMNLSITSGKGGKGPLTGSLGVSSSAQEGLTLSPSVSFSAKIQDKDKNNSVNIGASLGTSFNSRTGLKGLTLSTSLSQGKIKGSETAGGILDLSRSGTISFGLPTYTPEVSMPMVNTSAVFSLKIGGHNTVVSGTGDISGTYAQQKLETTEKITPAYGYMNLGQGEALSDAIMDFNREKDGSFTENTPALPITNLTYDVFSASGQGVSGTFRPFRSDLGYVFDPASGTRSDSYSAGVEVALGQLAHGGVDISVTDVNTTSGKWQNPATSDLVFQTQTSVSNKKFEPYYFKQVGELSVDEDPLINKVGGTDPVRLELNHQGGLSTVATDKIIADNNGITTTRTNGGLYGQNEIQLPSSSNNYRSQRSKRDQVASILTLGEAKKFGLQKDLYTNVPGKSYHIGEFSVLKSDGSRYVYGLPLYNNLQREVTFNVSGLNPNCQTGLVTYNPGVDNTTTNAHGIDGYFNAVETPGYAHSYLLTAILSPDYVDLTGDGPSDDDLGSYTKFTYDDPGSAVYKWRVPFEENSANYNEVIKSFYNNDYGDDQGSYVYGEKQLRYLQKIENKNYVAIFNTGTREDGVGVAGENGGLAPGSTSRMKLLDNIVLYSKPDYEQNGTTGATPIKTVHFVYSYTLCSPVPNNVNNEGKLTLDQVYFTYGTSSKGKLSPYKFYYKNDVNNASPVYSLKAYDRWGFYKPVASGLDCHDPYSPLSNAEYPYVDQNDLDNDKYVALWNLNKIELPSGGTINVEYESDDYAYVQDKQAMEMFKVADINTTALLSGRTNMDAIEKGTLINNPASPTYDNKNCLIFKLKTPIDETTPSGTLSQPDASEWVRQHYGYYSKDFQDKMYFRFLTNMTKEGGGPNQGKNYEYVFGYAGIEEMGVLPVNSFGKYDYGYVKLKNGTAGNAVSMAAWAFGRLHTPFLVWNSPTPGTATFADVILALARSSFISQISDFVNGPNGSLRKRGYGNEFILNKSWIRLGSPDMEKKGGGLRVKKVLIDDNWAGMVGSTNTGLYDSEYGQEYDYQMEDGSTNADGTTRKISSGVACYEPALGGDENPWRMPIYFGDKDEHLLVPDEKHYLDGPLGESFFPAPVVGYRQVTVKNLQHVGVTKHATGFVVYKFYTAYDFPTIIRSTELDMLRQTTNPIVELFSFNHRDYMTASQGYSIELNDMHGKPKGDYVYAEGGLQPISSVEYHYKAVGNQLQNDVPIIDEKGNISTATLGMESDFVADMRQQHSDILGSGASFNIAGFLAGIFPIIIPSIFPSFSHEATRFHSAVMTKVIRRYGLLDETIVRDANSQISTQNLAYDGETGEVLLTKTKNDFDDLVYSFSYPAHWGYDGMGLAYKNVGVEFDNIAYDQATKAISISSPSDFFVKGDEVYLIDQSAPNDPASWHKGWVTNVGTQSTDVVTIVDNEANGFATGNYNVKIIRSGRRNQQSLPIGKLVSKNNPLDNFNQNYFAQVINAEAAEYSDDWKIACNCGGLYGNKNDYYTGRRGNWRLQKSYLYLTDRTQSHTNNNTNIRKDGTYVNYSPFWKQNGNGFQPNDIGWTWKSKVTLYNRHGMELENEDALNRYSAATYGYDNTLPTAVSANAMYRETGFDGFEDYYINPNCSDDHFSFRQDNIVRVQNNGNTSSTANITDYIKEDRSHTGRYSIELNPGDNVQLVRELDQCPPEDAPASIHHR